MTSTTEGMMVAVKVSLICNIILFIIKAITLVIVHSLAVVADLGISVISLVVSGLLYYAVQVADKPADYFHNYGYGKIENVAEAIEGIVLIGLALAMTVQAILHLLNPGGIHSPLIGLIGSSLGILINFWGSAFIIKSAEQSSSPALKAEGIHFRLEGYISLAITLSFAVYMLLEARGYHSVSGYVDPIATLIVSAVIALPSFHLLRDAFFKLLDASIGESSQMDVIKVLARHHERFCNFTEIRTRSAGRTCFVDVRLVMPDHLSIKATHEVAVAVEQDIARAMKWSDVRVQIEPCARNCVFVKRDQPCPYASQS